MSEETQNESAPNVSFTCSAQTESSNVQLTTTPPTLTCETETDPKVPISPPLAGRWRRWAARMLDYNLECLLLGVVIGILAPITGFSVPESSNLMPSNGSEFFFGILCCFFVFLLDSLIYATFGNTLGKFLFGVKTVMQFDKSCLTGFYYFTRNMYIYACVFCFGIPLIPLFTSLYQQRRLYNGKPASYDERLRVMSIVHHAHWLRTFLGIILFIVTIFTIAYINGEENRRRNEALTKALNSEPDSPQYNHQ